jgi:hypothetical protein
MENGNGNGKRNGNGNGIPKHLGICFCQNFGTGLAKNFVFIHF